MSSYRTLFILLNICFAFPSLMFLGDLTDDISDYRPYTETFQSFRTNEITYQPGKSDRNASGGKMRNSRYQNDQEKYLILQTEEGTEWFIGEGLHEYWKILASENNKRKPIKFYTRGDQYFYLDPVRVELESQVIYDNTKMPLWKSLFLGLTLILTIYNFRSGKTEQT